MTINIEFAPKRKDGTRNVRILIVNGRGAGNRVRIPTNIYVHPSDIGTRTSKGKKYTYIKNERIQNQLDTIIAEAKENVLKNDPVIRKKRDTQQVKAIVVGDYGLPTFFRFAEEWLEKTTIKGKDNYKTAVKRFREHVGRDIAFSEINYEILKTFEESLANTKRAQSLYIGAIRHIWNLADEKFDEKMPRTPFKRYHAPKQKMVGQRAVSMKIIRKIYEYEGTGLSELARDCAVLSFCLIGMNSADLYNATTLEDGIIKYNRTKTFDRREDKAYMETKVPWFIADLMEKYKDPTGERIFNFHKRYSNFKNFNKYVNRGLKRIIPALQFYQIRHTWASIARNDIRASKEDVNEALVHIDENMKVTDLYIMKDFTIVNEINQKVIDYVYLRKWPRITT